jgi:RNA ligase
MRVDWRELQQARGEGLLAIVPHPDPDAGLFLLNYTARAQFQQAWDRYPLLLDCRGTVVNVDGDVVAKPLAKFFNVGERPETRLERLAALGVPEVTHKLDGSMCVLFPYDGGYRLATRGSFTSAQAVRATAIWDERYAATLAARLDTSLTYVFELIAPNNRIVVRYDQEALTLIGLVVTESGQELPYAAVRRVARRLDLPTVDEEALTGDWQALLQEQRANFEGFVLFWPAHNLRVKVKLAEYVRLHRIISGLSEHVVWEHLRAGTDLDAVRAVVPEEVRPWLDETAASLARAHAELAAEVERVVALVRAAGLDPADRAQRKEVARIVLREREAVRPAAFRALDGKGYADMLWQLLEPRGAEPVRAVDEE